MRGAKCFALAPILELDRELDLAAALELGPCFGVAPRIELELACAPARFLLATFALGASSFACQPLLGLATRSIRFCAETRPLGGGQSCFELAPARFVLGGDRAAHLDVRSGSRDHDLAA